MQAAAAALLGGPPPVGPPAGPAGGGALPPLAPQPTSYLDLYVDPSADAYTGNYVNLYQGYSPGANAPQDIRSSLYRDGNTGTHVNILVHVRDNAADPAEPGKIVAYHRLTRKDPRFGQPPAPYEQIGLGFFGDLVNGQAPPTVTIPDGFFSTLPVTQVPTAARLQQLFAAQPDVEVFGPFLAGDNDVDPVTSRVAMIVPNRYVTPLLTRGMTPKEAFLALSGMIQQDGNTVACEPLLDWLRTTLTRRAAGLPPRTVVTPLSSPVFQDPQDQHDCTAYRLGIMHRDLPHTVPGVQHNSAVLIAQGISSLTQEQRLAREEAIAHRQTKDAPKKPSDYFGVLLERLMRWCQVDSEDDLPPIYDTLANTKKGKIRLALQTALEDSLSNLGYLEEFPVSATLATKIVDLKWHSHLQDDFTVGLNIFCFGSMDEEAMEELRRVNQHYDTITNGEAAPSLVDVATLQDHKYDVFIPKTLAQLRYSVERSEALWQVLLGAHHPVTRQHRAYKVHLSLHEKRLERVVPRDLRKLHLVPALLARVVQVDVNHFLLDQSRSPGPLPFDRMTEVFGDIARARQWEPQFPARYLNEVPFATTSTVPPAINTSGASLADTALTTPSTLPPSVAPTAPTAPTAPNPAGTIVRNSGYNAALFGEYKAKGIKTGKLKAALHDRGNIKVPRNSSNVTMCIPYHVIGMCNTRCHSVADHAPHSEADANTLATWCAEHYHLN